MVTKKQLLLKVAELIEAMDLSELYGHDLYESGDEKDHELMETVQQQLAERLRVINLPRS